MTVLPVAWKNPAISSSGPMKSPLGRKGRKPDQTSPICQLLKDGAVRSAQARIFVIPSAVTPGLEADVLGRPADHDGAVLDAARCSRASIARCGWDAAGAARRGEAR